ncbi:probable sodium metabolite cotransporter BASS3, chloroplastic [Olea europaea subsp. europaea]|uniref:Probable sodium metabolite cotransporter BASS3, chloroplastic n=1 Tax=Olea europaea subsp. europaea TaxID=158383 RepID=A0A8S0PN54_OLEEU|nr:probable sodium metabolite cotransporter BASS3, chloroplastic [Olea europaea subsp. europaea]
MPKKAPTCVNGGSLFAVACSPSSPFVGKVGMQRREGNYSLLSFGVKSVDTKGIVTEMEAKVDASQDLSAMLPFVVALTAVAALSHPSTFTWVSKELYAPALGGIMFSIGIKLSFDDFALAYKRPVPLSVGFIAQYVLKPALGVFVARSFEMSPVFYAGFVLISCVAGAQLSSYASFLSKGDVALSILLTSSTTIASVLVTPFLAGLLIGSFIPVDAVAMAKSILQDGEINLTVGWYCGRLKEDECRTISLCTGMQNSTLAGLLVTQFLGCAQAVPPAFSVFAMAIIGLCQASFWGSGYRIRDLPSLLIPHARSTINT